MAITAYKRRVGGHAPCSSMPEHFPTSRERTKLLRSTDSLVEAFPRTYSSWGSTWAHFTHTRGMVTRFILCFLASLRKSLTTKLKPRLQDLIDGGCQQEASPRRLMPYLKVKVKTWPKHKTLYLGGHPDHDMYQGKRLTEQTSYLARGPKHFRCQKKKPKEEHVAWTGDMWQ